MVIHNHTSINAAAVDTVFSDVLANEAPSIIAGKKPKRRSAKATKTSLNARTDKQVLADQLKDERRREAEVEQKETDSRFTSAAFIRVIECIFGSIDFDPCWHEASAVRPKAYLDVRQGHNGLRDEWSGNFIFVNPPWSAQDKWLRRAHEQWSKGNAHTIICLVPAKTDTKFFHQTLIKEADLYFIEGRPRFSKEDGTSEATKVATMLVIFGATKNQKAKLAGLVRGAWWHRARTSLPPTKKASVNSLKVAKKFGSRSCVAPSTRRHANRIVFCGPSNGLNQPARLA